MFISHAHEDAEFAHRLAGDLQRNGWRVWIALESIQPGEKWGEAINRGLETSGIFILLLTPAAVRSRWVATETDVAVGLEHKGTARFIPLKVERCDVPPLWSAYQVVPFLGHYETGLTALLTELERGRVPAPLPEGAEGEVVKRRVLPWAWVGLAAGLLLAGVGLWPIIKGVVAPSGQTTTVPAATVIQRPSSALVPPTVAFVETPTSTTVAASPTQILPNLTPGPTRVSDKDDMVMVYVPAGEFLMGSIEADTEEDNNEKPPHRVYLDAFWIDRTEVTKAQYQQYVEAGKCAVPGCSDTLAPLLPVS